MPATAPDVIESGHLRLPSYIHHVRLRLHQIVFGLFPPHLRGQVVSFVLSLCLVVPGVCDVPELDDYLDAVAVHHSAGPIERWRPLVSMYFPSDEIDRALCIIRHESSGDPGADNPTSSARGLFQILGSLWAPHYGIDRRDLYDPLINTRLASDIWENYGWGAWSPYQRGACR